MNKAIYLNILLELEKKFHWIVENKYNKSKSFQHMMVANYIENAVHYVENHKQISKN